MPETSAARPDLSAAFDGAAVLVTGGLGFIGSNLVLRLVALGARPVLVDNLNPNYGGNLFNIEPVRDRVRVDILDIRDAESLARLLPGCRFIFNLAAQTSHLDSMHDPLTDLDINSRAQLTLLEACRRLCPEAAIVYASTRQIYGRPLYLPVDEKHPLRPVDVNGVDKMSGEAFHTLYHDVYGLKTASLRLTNTYGPRMRIRDARQTFVGIWLRAVLDGQPFEVWDGAQLRDLTYVDDAVDAFLLAAIVPGTEGRAFNIGGGEPLALRDLADRLVAANGGGRFALREFPAERKRIDIGHYHADDRAFRDLTGWAPAVSIEEGLARSLAYFRENFAHYV